MSTFQKEINKLRLRFSESGRINLARYGISLFATLLIGTVLILAEGADISTAVHELFKGAFGSKIAIGNTLHWAAPCMLVGIAALVAFKSGVFNLGMEGQLYFGALAAGCCGYMFKLPPVLHVLVCILAGGTAGMLYALIPALMKLYFKVNEVVSTLLLNYIGILATELIALMLISGDSATGTQQILTPMIKKTAALTPIIKGTSATTALGIAVLVILVVDLLYKRMLIGYEMKMVGENLEFSKAGGVNANKMFLIIFLVSGFIAGVCGAVETLGVNKRFIAQFSTNLGWDGVMVTRIANNSPVGVLFISVIWGAFKAGAMQMERVTTLNRYVVNLLQALFVLFISVDYGMLYRKYKAMKTNKALRKGGTD